MMCEEGHDGSGLPHGTDAAGQDVQAIAILLNAKFATERAQPDSASGAGCTPRHAGRDRRG